MIENKKFQLSFNEHGYVSNLTLKDDPYKMNWVIDGTYLQKALYDEHDKLFGSFDLIVDGEKQSSHAVTPSLLEKEEKVSATYDFPTVRITVTYDLTQQENSANWSVQLLNKMSHPVQISEFGIWISFAYVMFRDKNVLKNIHNSAAVFPSISSNYTKLSLVRRDGVGENLGMYQTKGETRSIGTYCTYQNLFFENVSPSLDGMLFHKLYLAGGYPEGFKNNDWIYDKSGFQLNAGEEKVWEYSIAPSRSEEEFYQTGLLLNHPKIQYAPLNIIGETVRGTMELPEGLHIKAANVLYKANGSVESSPVSVAKDTTTRLWKFSFEPAAMGEHKVVFTFTDGTEDFIVLNVMDHLETVINERVDYICSKLYTGENGSPAYAFEPISNQGESLGKANLVLKKNLLGDLDMEQVRKVERSAVYYVRPKWFIDGDFKHPRKLYGDFYRCMDFEYIGHLFCLLSEFDDSVLELNSAHTYLEWAADVFELRVNPDLHDNERGKEEAQMLGVYFLYFNQLLEKLKNGNLMEQYYRIHFLWDKLIDRIEKEAPTYKAAITEHFYDNAGFGPTAGALSDCGRDAAARSYGELLLANIGYSNDFRAQNPDRWWEALAYMIHSLWGGVTAAAAYKVFWLLKDPAYLDASYRATAAVLYCYDTHATAVSHLEKGMAASTYAVAGPHINRPDLSRDRFGQSIFFRDGGIFARLFENDSQTPDWDMGEELVAYLDSFGTKTFIIREEDTIQVINGSFYEDDSDYVITSYAPYISNFYCVSDCDIIPLMSEKGQKQIRIKKN